MEEILKELVLTHRRAGFNPRESIAYARTSKVFAYFEKLGLVYISASTSVKIVKIKSSITYRQFREIFAGSNTANVQCICPNGPTINYQLDFVDVEEPRNIAQYLYAMNYVKFTAIHRVLYECM